MELIITLVLVALLALWTPVVLLFAAPLLLRAAFRNFAVGQPDQTRRHAGWLGLIIGAALLLVALLAMGFFDPNVAYEPAERPGNWLLAAAWALPGLLWIVSRSYLHRRRRQLAEAAARLQAQRLAAAPRLYGKDGRPVDLNPPRREQAAEFAAFIATEAGRKAGNFARAARDIREQMRKDRKIS